MSEIFISTVFLEIPFTHVDFAKQNKLKWCPEEKKWAVNDDHPSFNNIVSKYRRVYLQVDYKDKDKVKSHGAKWDFDNKRWYSYMGNQQLIPFMVDEEL